jgi:Protein of unknown function (DUF2892)
MAFPFFADAADLQKVGTRTHLSVRAGQSGKGFASGVRPRDLYRLGRLRTLLPAGWLQPTMKQNEAAWDRGVRVVLGVGLISLTMVGPETPLGWLGLIPLITGVWGFCPLYRLLGVSTCPVSK